MKFQNAYLGVKKIFAAEILSIIVAVVLVASAVLGIVGIASAAAEDGVTAVITLLSTIVFIIAAAVLAIIAFIFTLIGILKGAKDEPIFKGAFVAVIVGIAVAVLSSVFSKNTLAVSLFNTIGDVAQVIVTIYVVTAIVNLANQLGDEKTAKTGHTVLLLIVIVCALSFIANITVLCFGYSTTPTMIAGVLALVAEILTVVQYVIYLVYLGKAKKMLKA